MTIINNIRKVLVGAAIIASASPAAEATMLAGGPEPAPAASTRGTADVVVNVPNFIILHYYSALTLNFETPESLSIKEGSNDMDVAWDGKVSGNSELENKSLSTAALELDGTVTTVKIPNVWAVRGFSENGKAGVSIAIPDDGDELARGSSIIGLSNAKVTSEKEAALSITVTLNGIAKSQATLGGIEMDLDFTNTQRSGEHKGGKYVISAVTM
ncbi:MAG: hypothetical protein K9G39_10855 [Chlorobium sp.]|uniref:hypothetical protein n=1 Tax=Chlorobium sp. TaxID=1095 RepID=UPI0025C33325|nr:hypothetical protein [Chlorobium sp.]MCF8384067.1 hypothetical protein [Chlorobium sp.]